MKKKSLIVFVVFSSLLFLGACSKTSPSLNSTEKAVSTESSSNESEHGAGMRHNGHGTGMRHSGQIPSEMVPAANPKYPVGTSVTITTGHMDGMMNAKATIDKAMKGTVYVVDYEPTNGSDMVKNHMWVTESELKQS